MEKTTRQQTVGVASAQSPADHRRRATTCHAKAAGTSPISMRCRRQILGTAGRVDGVVSDRPPCTASSVSAGSSEPPDGFWVSRPIPAVVFRERVDVALPLSELGFRSWHRVVAPTRSRGRPPAHAATGVRIVLRLQPSLVGRIGLSSRQAPDATATYHWRVEIDMIYNRVRNGRCCVLRSSSCAALHNLVSGELRDFRRVRIAAIRPGRST